MALLAALGVGGAVSLGGYGLAQTAGPVRDWWDPGSGRTMAAVTEYPNAMGSLGVINADGPIETKGHPFFEPMGPNGRACVTCHQPADGMSISAETIQARWRKTGGKDPLFAAIDGSNCPSLPQDKPESHSLLLNRGLVRVSLPWPPKNPDGSRMDPEFTLEVVRDPTGCNTSAAYGLKSADPRVSVYRRPRPLANMRYVVSDRFGVSLFIGKNGLPAATDPATGKPVNMNLMADARAPTLKVQAQDAAHNHLEMKASFTPEQLAKIEAFERQLYAAQDVDAAGGSLMEPGGPTGLGSPNVAKGRDGLLGNNTSNYVVPMENKWKSLPRTGDAKADAKAAFRESVQRGHDVFFFRTFWIRDAMHINTVGLGNPTKRTCATCHGMHMMGMDTANGWMDIGTTNRPWARETPLNPWNPDKPEMPLFRLTCKPNVAPHPYLGRVIYTQDPGRALISGRCNDIGTIVIQQMRALSARAPYFSNGSAENLREVVDYYDRRFNIGYTQQEKADLVNFLSVL